MNCGRRRVFDYFGRFGNMSKKSVFLFFNFFSQKIVNIFYSKQSSFLLKKVTKKVKKLNFYQLFKTLKVGKKLTFLTF